jgi:hypothetical protein
MFSCIRAFLSLIVIILAAGLALNYSLAAGLVDVGTQPAGGLSGKIAYIHGGHGYTADNLGGGNWSYQRGNLLGMVEDLGNVDVLCRLLVSSWRNDRAPAAGWASAE